MPTPPSARKGISKSSDMTPALLADLESGRLEAATLTEELSINFSNLARNCLPGLPADFLVQVEAIAPLGIVKRMQAMGELLATHPAPPSLADFAAQRSNLVRSWGCFIIAAWQDTPLAARLEAMRPFADDTHYGVREWAWLALYPFALVGLFFLMIFFTLTFNDYISRWLWHSVYTVSPYSG